MINSLYSVIYSFLIKSLPIIIGGIAVSYLSVKEYGEFSLFLLYVTTLSLFVVFGLGASCNIIFSNKNNREEYKSYFFIKSCKYWLFFYCLTSLAFFIYSIYFEINNKIFYILSLGVFSLGLLFEGVLYGFRKYKELIVVGLISFVLTIILYYFFGKHGLYYFLLIYLLTRSITLILYWFYVKKIFNGNFRVDSNYFNDKFKLDFKNITIPFFLTTLCSGPIYAVNLFYVEKKLGIESFSYLNWAYQLYLISIFIPIALTPIIMSKFSSGVNFKIFYKILVGVLIFQLLIVSIFFVFLDNFLIFAGNLYLENSKISSLVFFLCSMLSGLNSVFMSFWPAIGMGRVQLLSQFIFIVILTIVNFIFLPLLGILSFPISMLIAFCIQAVFQIIFFFKVKYDCK